jgi:2-amino-4-hydroxy-6-hydroxymethyldihydropteridine diphosphokinase
MGSLHPVVREAAAGQLPAWAEVDEARRAHIDRVASLLREWAVVRGESPQDVARWTAAGYLHDALRGAQNEELRQLVPEAMAELPGNILHGPAAAERLRLDGVGDEELLRAVEYHTLGHAGFGDLGLALYAADFLEPGRRFRNEWRAELRTRMPGELEEVVREILAARIRHLLDRDRPVRPETMEFWNTMTSGQAWASASEL